MSEPTEEGNGSSGIHIARVKRAVVSENTVDGCDSAISASEVDELDAYGNTHTVPSLNAEMLAENSGKSDPAPMYVIKNSGRVSLRDNRTASDRLLVADGVESIDGVNNEAGVVRPEPLPQGFRVWVGNHFISLALMIIAAVVAGLILAWLLP
ncbi:hypothetical protein [Pseudomonas abyssi]|uniref:hypothetical protein n=1 Tax=Pseudomonas abyssi TaxID=170540 RepID=UPI003C7D2B59